MRKQMKYTRQNGFSIMEVLIGIFIFVVGMLALSSLQGALTRSMADAKLRTTAVNIAEFTIESNRGFRWLLSDPNQVPVFAYNDIVSVPATELPAVNGVIYERTIVVTDYYHQLASDSFSTTPTNPSASDYKQVEVTVSWNAAQNFRGDEGTEITAASLGSGSVKLTGTIPAIVTSASARVAGRSNDDGVAPDVTYEPGANPDVVALSLGDSKFKESLLPEPDVQRTGDLVQTTFDVITYSSSNGNQFLRREEFAAVSCECTLRAADGNNQGRRPVIWAGDEYMAGHLVTKPYGESANNKNSSLCDSCCRDHHDGGAINQTGDSGDEYSNVYGPFRADTEYTSVGQARRTADHKHYQEDGTTIADTGDTYLEACRLVRVDGFFKVAQDFRREDQYVFPEDFLDEDTEVTTYSNYVTTAAESYKNSVSDEYPTNSPPCIGGSSPCIAFPDMQGPYPTDIETGQLPSWTKLQTGVTDSQQLRSRGIYLDYMSVDLRKFMTSCFDGTGTLKNNCCVRNGVVLDNNPNDSCTADDLYIDKTGSPTRLEVLPFFEVQLTKLENWDQAPKDPLTVALANEAIEDANAHDRGIAAQWIAVKKGTIVLGGTEVMAHSHRGNIGFTNTLAIDLEFDDMIEQADLQLVSLDSSGSGSIEDGDPIIRIEGVFSESVSGDPAIAVVGVGDVICGLMAGGYFCNVSTAAVEPAIIVYGYEDTHILDPLLVPTDTLETRYACSNVLIHDTGSPNASVGDTNATFKLYNVSGLLGAGSTYDIEITTTSCGPIIL